MLFETSLKVSNLLYNAYQLIIFRKNVFFTLIVKFFGENSEIMPVVAGSLVCESTPIESPNKSSALEAFGI